MPLRCNKQPPGKSTIYCIEFFELFVSTCTEWRSQPTKLGRGNLLTLSEQQYFVFDAASQTAKRQDTWGKYPLAFVYARTPTVFSGRESCACFRNKHILFFRSSRYFLWSNDLDIINSILL